MKNYYEHIAELKIAEERLEYKLREKENIYNKYFSIVSKIKDVIARNNAINDKMSEYLIELEETGLSAEIERLQNQVNELKYHKNKMEEYLSGLEGVEYDFIKLRYFEEHHYTLEEIAQKLGYSIDRIKQLSANYEREIKKNYTSITLKK